MIERKLGVLPPELEARIKKVMAEKKFTFNDACIFLLRGVVHLTRQTFNFTMRVVSPMSKNMTFEITIGQMAFFTAAVVELDRLRMVRLTLENALRGKRDSLRLYQTKCEKEKIRSGRGENAAAQDGKCTTASVAGATVEPQHNEPNADAKTDAVLLKNETEGRVSGGVRAGIDA